MFTHHPNAGIHGYSGPTYPGRIDELTTCFRAVSTSGDALIAKLRTQLADMCDSIEVRREYQTKDDHQCRAMIFVRRGPVALAVSVPGDMTRSSAVYFDGGTAIDRDELIRDMLMQLDLVRA